MPATQLLRRLTGSGLLITAVLSGGCATTAAPPVDPLVEEADTAPQSPELIPVVRYGRYTLVELVPTAAQRDLLLQVIDVAMPADARATVGDGLRHALQRSGYQLCENAHAVIELYSLPLPAAHLYLGPMTLRDAYAAQQQSSAAESKSLIEVEKIVDQRRAAALADTSRSTADVIAQASASLVAANSNRRDALLSLIA